MNTIKSLEELKNASSQQIFDRSAWHLLEQNQKSEAEDHCLYRGPNGLGCAASVFIPEPKYKKEMERKEWRRLVQDYPQFESPHTDLICDLQNVHDDHSVHLWRFFLRKLAIENGLTYTFDR